jgi:hypothetical protein
LIIELLAITAILVAGGLLASTLGSGIVVASVVGFPLGAASAVVLAGLIAVTGINSHPSVPFAGALVLGAVAAWRWGPRATHRHWWPLVLPAFAIWVALAAGLRIWGAVNVTPDSYRYATTGALLAGGELSQATPFLLLTRALAVPAIHAPANLSGELHLRSVAPLMALATVGLLVWLIGEGLSRAMSPGMLRATQVVAALLLLSVNRFVFHAFYVNGHLFVAAWLLWLVGSIWLDSRKGSPATPVTLIRCLLVAAIVLARPDGALIAGLALIPLLSNRNNGASARILPMVALGATTLAWNIFLVTRSGDAPSEAYGMILGGSLTLITAALVAAAPSVLPKRFPLVAELALWGAAVVGALARPWVAWESARATVENVLLGSGGWGVSAVVLGVLSLSVLALSVDHDRTALRFPLTTFVPLGLLLALLRGTPYRIGPGDSLNRMLIQFVPLAILFLASAVAATQWRVGWSAESHDTGLPRPSRVLDTPSEP